MVYLLYLFNKQQQYNSTIIDLYDRSVIASATGPQLDTNLGIATVKTAL